MAGDILGQFAGVPNATALTSTPWWGNAVGSETMRGPQSMTMPTPGVSPLADAQGRRMFGGPYATEADVARRQAATNAMLGMSEGGLSIKAFHGSPHMFEKFDPAKIGTGEGAQAYGHGLYFAEKEGTARSYRDALTPTESEFTVSGTPLLQELNSSKNAPEKSLALESLYRSRNLPQTIQDLTTKSIFDPAYTAAAKWLKDNESSIVETPPSGRGHMYEVALHADPEHMLDWDKPLSEQHPKVREALSTIAERDFRPEDPGSSLAPNTRAMAQKYNAAGIPGIRYFDAGSRNRSLSEAGMAEFYKLGEIVPGYAGQDQVVAFHPGDPKQGGYGWSVDVRKVDREGNPVGPIRNHRTTPGEREIATEERRRGTTFDRGPQTHNYVVFDPNTIEILRRYGLAGLIGGGGAAAATTQDNR